MNKKIISLFTAISLIALPLLGNANTKTPAKDVTVDTSTFGKQLPITADTVQKALQDINDFSFTASAAGVQNQMQINDGGVLAGGNLYSRPGGNIGVGITNPTEQLEVNGIIKSDTGGIKFPDNTIQTTAATGGTPAGTNEQIQYNNNGVFGGGPAVFHLGNTGIGTDPTHPPATLLSVGISNNGGSLTKNAFNIDLNGNITNLGGLQANINASTVNLTNTNGPINFGNAGGGSTATGSIFLHVLAGAGFISFAPSSDVEKMRLDANGRLGIGTTTPAYPLDVIGIAQSYGFHTPSVIGGITSQLGLKFDPTGEGPVMVINPGPGGHPIGAGRYVGINNLTPTHDLDVGGIIAASTDVLVQGVSVCREDGTNCPGASGAVTSVGMTGDGVVFNSTVTGSPITSSGTLVPALLTHVKNTVLSGPTTGADAAPTFRALVGSDLPNPSATTLGGTQSAAAVSHQWINSISTSGVPALSQPAQADITGLTTADAPSFAGETLTGNLTLSTHDIVTDTTTGTKIGTSTSQKIGFFNSTPIVKPSGAALTALSNLGLITSPTLAQSDISGLTTASSPSFTGLTLSGISGSTQCLQVNSSGVVSGTSCGGGVTVNSATTGYMPYYSGASAISGVSDFTYSATRNSSSGTDTAVTIAPTWTGSGTEGYTALKINSTETSTGSGSKLLLDLQLAGTSKASIDDTGAGTFGGSGGITANGGINVPTGQEYDSNGYRLGHNITVYAAGTVYTMTASDAAVAFGTTSPAITVDNPGTYMLYAVGRVIYNGATYAGTQTATLHLHRTNETPGDIAGATSTMQMRILTTTTDSVGAFTTAPIIYTTSNSDDAIALYGSVSATPSAGSVQVTEATIIAVRLY